MRPRSGWALSVTLGVLMCWTAGASMAARAQSVSKEELSALAPGERDLQGFTQVRPAGELPPVAEGSGAPARIDDIITEDLDLSSTWGARGKATSFSRFLYSLDGQYRVNYTILVCDSSESAVTMVQAYHRQSSMPWTPGAYGTDANLGEESWTHPSGPGGHSIMVRYGRLFLDVDGSLSNRAAREQVKAEFPPEAVEAIAETILLRLSRVASIAGKGSGSAAVAVNGQALPGRTTLVSGRPKVAVADVAKLAGWKVAWDAKTGKVTLSRGGRQVRLAAGSMSATVGAEAKRVALKSPVLKDAGQPVMDLGELAGLLGGMVVEKTAERVSVKI